MAQASASASFEIRFMAMSVFGAGGYCRPTSRGDDRFRPSP